MIFVIRIGVERKAEGWNCRGDCLLPFIDADSVSSLVGHDDLTRTTSKDSARSSEVEEPPETEAFANGHIHQVRHNESRHVDH